MKDFDLDYLIKNVADLCSIPIRYYKSNGETIVYTRVELKIDPFDYVKNEVFNLKNNIDYYVTKNNFYYIITQNKDEKIVIGPSAFTQPQDYELNRIIFELKLSPEEGISFKNTMKTIIPYPIETLLQIACSINYVLNNEKVKLSDILLKDLPTFTPSISPLENEEETHFSHNTLKIENEILDIVRTGDLNRLDLYVENIGAIRTNLVADTLLRQTKDMFIVTVTLASRTAMKEGLNNEEGLSLSDVFIHRIENAHNTNELNAVILDALREYTTRVHYLKSIENQSKFTLELSNYIIHNISKKITIQDLVNKFYISKTSLCNKVKKESGYSINEFINQTKITVAKNLLETTTNSILSISDYLGYSSQNHFEKVFKKIVGITPREFRNSKNN